MDWYLEVGGSGVKRGGHGDGWWVCLRARIRDFRSRAASSRVRAFPL